MAECWPDGVDLLWIALGTGLVQCRDYRVHAPSDLLVPPLVRYRDQGLTDGAEISSRSKNTPGDETGKSYGGRSC
jgi:hypothetical protein